ncbi:DUF3310 domain-containing protein [Leucobacter sp. M11]|uniref:DUF3310 domain-containing protein n=1 Tax=Leucobacter sp. M11 TaxID=2993565 RepID=UPI002D7F7995|nr:DUF3310 domain-containing protein [Leucobacter sp. M11]MEB4614017.1 DUF3310 domain-containing protein [Leucobacter sp. M11]
MTDPINPDHYRRFPVEVIDLTEHLNFNRGNAVKYLARAGAKPGADELVDLRKAAWYVDREITRTGGVTELAETKARLEEARQRLREAHADHEAERARLLAKIPA